MANSLQHIIVARALELISDEAHWTRGALAVTDGGDLCATQDLSAQRFCALGALFRAAEDLLGDGHIDHAQLVAQHVMRANNRYGSLPAINDSEGHAVIIAMFRNSLAA